MEEKAASPSPATPLPVKSAAMALVKSVSPVAHIVAYNSAWASALGFGCGLLLEKGFKGSLAMAASAPKYYAMSCGVHGLLSTLLKAVRRKHDGLSAGAAGCGVGLFHAAFLGSPIFDHVESCLFMGVISMMDHARTPLEKSFAQYIVDLPAHSDLKTSTSLVSLKSFDVTLSSIINTAFFDTIRAAAAGAIYGYAVGISIGIDTTIRLLLHKIRGKNDVINAGLAGCFVGLYGPQDPPGSPNHLLLSSCIGYGFCAAVLHKLGKYEIVLPSDPQEEVYAVANVLPPFILPFPSNIKDDFFAFCESLKEYKKSSH